MNELENTQHQDFFTKEHVRSYELHKLNKNEKSKNNYRCDIINEEADDDDLKLKQSLFIDELSSPIFKI